MIDRAWHMSSVDIVWKINSFHYFYEDIKAQIKPPLRKSLPSAAASTEVKLSTAIASNPFVKPCGRK